MHVAVLSFVSPNRGNTHYWESNKGVWENIMNENFGVFKG
jgi:hypothetical protein